MTKKEMQALDRAAIDGLGIPPLVLMEVAGRAVADRVEARAKGRAVLALAGLGNNGGDAIVAARHLRDRGVDVTVAIAGDPAGGSQKASDDMKAELAIAAKLGAKPEVIGDQTDLAALFQRHAVVIDGLFGTGLSRPIDGAMKKIIDALNASQREVVAVDIASGIDADNGQILGAAVRATETVTFQHAKLGHALHPGREYTGALHVADIGIPRALVRNAAAFIAEGDLRPKRDANAHKGTYGHLLVVAGVPDRPGSSLLSARAALRIGAGLVTIGSDAETIRRLAPALVELMGTSIALDANAISKELASKTALAIGPSLTPNDATRDMLIELLNRIEVPAVVDAGALAALGDQIARIEKHRAPIVLTPHPGEMAKLIGSDTKRVQSDRVEVARALAKRVNAIVVLKGASTVIAHPSGKVGIVLAGNPGMATGGTGDVLTGIIGGLLAQKLDAFDAACTGAWLHATAGDRVADTQGGRLIASDIIEALR